MTLTFTDFTTKSGSQSRFTELPTGKDSDGNYNNINFHT